MARNPQAWLIPSEIEPAFDGGMIQNQFIKGTLFIFHTNAQKLALKKLYRIYDGESSTMCYVTSENALYVLNNDVAADTTSESDWTAIQLGSDSAIEPVGEWSASTGFVVETGDPLLDTEAVGNNGEFYVVTDAPSGVTDTYAGLFRDLSVTVYDGDYVMSVGSYFAVFRPTVTWDTLNKPQVIEDYVNGIVIAHAHLAADITDLPALLALKIDRSEIASIIENNLANITDAEIVSVGFLRKWIYFKDETYSKAQVDALITLGATSFPFDGNRPISKIPTAGEILGTANITDWQEEAYYGKEKPIITLDSIDTIEIGASIAPTVKGTLLLNQYDFIVSITVFNELGVDVGNPSFTAIDPVTNIDFQVDTPIVGLVVPTEGYRIEVVISLDAVESTFTTTIATVTTVYPFLYGAGATGLSAVDKYTDLSKLIEIDGNKTVTIDSVSNKMYFCMPEEYADRVEIIDAANGNLLGSLFPASPATEQVDSSGLDTDWMHNYKVYEATYNTDSIPTAISFILDRDAFRGTDTTLDDILEGVVNKHLTKTLKDKLVNFNAADFLDKATYDIDDNAIVEYAAQTATNGKNITASIMPALTLVHITGADIGGEAFTIELADTGANKACNAITFGAIGVGEIGLIILKGFAGTWNLPGAQFEDIVYLSGLGAISLTPPATGLVQTIGSIINVASGDNVFISVNPQDSDDRNDFARDWRAFTAYEKDVQVIIDLSTVASVVSDAKIMGRVIVDDYTSTNDVQVDFLAGKLEIIGGDMATTIYDPTGIEKDVFDMDSMLDGQTEVDPAIRKVTITENQRIKLDGLQPSTFKGTFADGDALRTSFPTANDGDSANVTSTGTVWAWNNLLPPSISPPTVGGDWEDTLTSSGGDMLASAYDPTGKGNDAFSIDSMYDPNIGLAPIGTNAAIFIIAERSKLDNIEANATADQTAGEIETAYESNVNTNKFEDLEKTKLTGIEDDAKDDQVAVDVPYDPTGRAFISAIEVQGAFDELDATLNSLPSFYLDKATYDTNENGISDAAETIVIKALNDEAVPVTIGQVVYLNRETVDDKFFKLSANNDFVTLPISGFLLDDAIAGAEARIAVGGVFTVPTFIAAVADDNLYLTSTAGLVSVTPQVISNTVANVIPGRVLDVVGGNQIIEVGRKQHSTAKDVTIDNTTSTLVADTVQAALVELSDKTDKVMGTLSYNSIVGAAAAAGELVLPATLSTFSPNITTPANGRLEVGVDSDITVNVHISSEALVNGDSTEFEIAVDGVGTGIFCYRSIGGNQLQGESASMSHTLQLSAASYVSVLLTGSTVNVHAVQITIHGSKT